MSPLDKRLVMLVVYTAPLKALQVVLLVKLVYGVKASMILDLSLPCAHSAHQTEKLLSLMVIQRKTLLFAGTPYLHFSASDKRLNSSDRNTLSAVNYL